VVALKSGKWTIAIDGRPWRSTVDGAILKPIFSPDGKKVAAVVKKDEPSYELKPYNVWNIILDDHIWPEWFEMVWDPIFSPDGKKVAAKAEKNGKYSLVVNEKVWGKVFDALWPPVFSPDSSKILVRAIEDGKYYRHVVPVTEIVG
jgi:hypothetical protein